MIVIDDDYKGIGGSDASSILGYNQWRTAFDAWSSITGRTPRRGDPPSEAAFWGTMLEDTVAAHYMRVNDEWLVGNGKTRYRHDTIPWITGRPDRLVVHSDQFVYEKGGSDHETVDLLKRKHGLEVKTTSWQRAHEWGASGTAEVPEHVACQVHHYMMLTGLPRWDVALLIGGQEYRQYTVLADEQVQRFLRSELGKWWETHVVKDVPPPLDASPAAGAYLSERFRSLADRMTEGDDEAQKIFEAMRAKQQEAAVAKAEADRLRSWLVDRATKSDCRGFRFADATFRGVPMPGRPKYRELVEELLGMIGADDAKRLELSIKYAGKPSVHFRVFPHRSTATNTGEDES